MRRAVPLECELVPRNSVMLRAIRGDQIPGGNSIHAREQPRPRVRTLRCTNDERRALGESRELLDEGSRRGCESAFRIYAALHRLKFTLGHMTADPSRLTANAYARGQNGAHASAGPRNRSANACHGFSRSCSSTRRRARDALTPLDDSAAHFAHDKRRSIHAVERIDNCAKRAGATALADESTTAPLTLTRASNDSTQSANAQAEGRLLDFAASNADFAASNALIGTED